MYCIVNGQSLSKQSKAKQISKADCRESSEKGCVLKIPMRIQTFGLELSFNYLIPAGCFERSSYFYCCFRFVIKIIVLKSIIFDLN